MDSEKWYCEARKLLTKLYGQPYRIALACAVLVTKGSAIQSEDGAIILGETCSSSSDAKKLIFCTVLNLQIMFVSLFFIGATMANMFK